MKSLITKHSIVIAGHKTSVTLEAEFWKSVHEIAETRGESLSQRSPASTRIGNLPISHQLFACLSFASIAINPISGAERLLRCLRRRVMECDLEEGWFSALVGAGVNQG